MVSIARTTRKVGRSTSIYGPYVDKNGTANEWRWKYVSAQPETADS